MLILIFRTMLCTLSDVGTQAKSGYGSNYCNLFARDFEEIFVGLDLPLIAEQG